MTDPDVPMLLRRADAALATGQLAEAERAARAAIAAAPWSEAGHALLARAHLARGDHDEALRAAEGGIAATPESEWLQRLRALALNGMGRRKEALAAADEAVRLRPDVAPAHFVRSVVLETLKKLPEARVAAERAVELDPDDAGHHAQLGDLWLRQDPARAERHYRDSLRLDPVRAMTLNNLGVALEKQQRARDAALAFRSAVILDPTLELPKENAHGSLETLVGGGYALTFALGLTAIQIWRVVVRIVDGRTFRWSTFALAVAGVALTTTMWRSHRARVRRLAGTDPQLHAIYAKLEADRSLKRR